MTIKPTSDPAAPMRPPDTAPALTDGNVSHPNGESRYRRVAPPGAAQRPAVAGGVGLSAEAIRALPAAFPFDPVVPAAFGISRSAAYRALAAGQLPIRTLRLGRKLIVTRADLMAALGIQDTPPSPAIFGGEEHVRNDVPAPDPTCDHGKEGDR
jgi:hypothetical protein